MAENLQIAQELKDTAQLVQDETGNSSPLTLSRRRVGIGTKAPKEILDVHGTFKITNQGNGKILQLFGSDRSWAFKQLGTGAGTALELVSIGGGGNKNFIITTKGKVGIGTTAPEHKLDVDGNIMCRGDVLLTGADCAEEFKVEEDQEIEPGTVMVIGDEDKLHQCVEAYDKRVAGVLSGAGNYRPGIILGKQQSPHKRLPLALTGKVYCKVDAQYGPIGVGDLLTTSETPGHAMRAQDPNRAFGAVIGKALSPLASGQGLLPLLVALQ